MNDRNDAVGEGVKPIVVYITDDMIIVVWVACVLVKTIQIFMHFNNVNKT